MNHYMIGDHYDNERVKWVKVSNDSGEERYEFIDNASEDTYFDDVLRINDKYGDFLGSINSGKCTTSSLEVSRLNKTSVLKAISSFVSVIGIATLSSSISDVTSLDPGLGAVVGGFVAGCLLSSADNDRRKVKDIRRSGMELLVGKERRALNSLDDARRFLNVSRGVGVSLAGLCAVLSSVSGYFDGEFLSIMFALFSGRFIGAAYNKHNNLKKLPNNEEDYFLTDREYELLHGEKKVLSR